METNFGRTEFDTLIVLVKKNKWEKLAATTKSWKWAAVEKKVERSISSVKRVTGKFLEVSHRAWSSKTRVKKWTTKCAARASRLILWSSLLFVEYVNKQGRNFISLLTLDMVPWKSASRRFAYICQSKWVGIIAIKTERREFKFSATFSLLWSRWILKVLVSLPLYDIMFGLSKTTLLKGRTRKKNIIILPDKLQFLTSVQVSVLHLESLSLEHV